MRTLRSRIAGEAAEAENVRGAFARRGARAVAFGEGAEVGQRQPGRRRSAGHLDQLGLDGWRPAADHLDDRGVELLGVRQRRRLVDILGVADEGEVAVAELDRPAGDLSPEFVDEEAADRVPARGRKLFAR